MADRDDHRRDLAGQVDRHCDILGRHINVIARQLAHTHATRPIDRPPAEVRGRSSGRSDPTWATMAGWHDLLATETSRLVGHIRLGPDGDTVDQYGTPVAPDDPRCDRHGLVHDLHDLARRLAPDSPAPDTVIDDLRGSPPATLAWRHALAGCADYCHRLVDLARHGWHRLWDGRWVLGPGGSVVLDEDLDVEAAMTAGLIRQQAGAFRAAADRLELPPVRQEDLVDCAICGDLAKYRRMQRCDRCRRRELCEMHRSQETA